MSKHRARVQLRRKAGARNSEKGYGASLIDIYRRAIQGGSDAYLAANQTSDPDRIARLKQQAQDRRDKRNAKRIQVRVINESNGQPSSRNVPTKRSGKIRGLARRLLRQTA